jgi:hypothetical protein
MGELAENLNFQAQPIEWIGPSFRKQPRIFVIWAISSFTVCRRNRIDLVLVTRNASGSPTIRRECVGKHRWQSIHYVELS